MRDPGELRGARVVAAAMTPARTTCKLSPGVPSRTPPRILRMTVTNDGVRGTFTSYGDAGAFAFEENYDSGWSLIVDGRAVNADYHFVADGYANGWIVDVPAGTHTFAVRYAPAQLFRLLLIIQIVLWFVVAGGCALKYAI
jgi:uncharacterized membrane protein YfhO